MNMQTPPTKWSASLGRGGFAVALAGLLLCAAAMLIAAPRAYATENTVTVSDAQTEMFSTSVYLEDFKMVTPVIESVPSGWSKWTSASKEPCLYYSSGSYWKSGTATVKVRYDKIGKVNGKYVSMRLTFSNMKGDGPCDIAKLYNMSVGKAGSGFMFNKDDLGFTYYGLRQCDVRVELFDSSSKAAVSLKGGFVGFGSLNGKQGVGVEGAGYLSSADHKAYVLKTSNLTKTSAGIWKGKSSSGFNDVVGDKTYNKNSVSFGIVDASPSFRLTNEGTNNASFVSLTLTPLTAATPPSPIKSATISG